MSGVPFLPGYSFQDPRRTNYKKSQTLGFKNGLVIADDDPPSIGGVPHVASTIRAERKRNDNDLLESMSTMSMTSPERSTRPNTAAPPLSYVPAHIAFDKKVLNFYAYCDEPVSNSALERSRIRLHNIHLFLEDGSMQVYEPRVANSGLPQGVIVKRHMVPRPTAERPASAIAATQPASAVAFYTPEDLCVGADVNIYGRNYHITDADPFTRNFYMTELGIDLGEPEALPSDGYTEIRKQIEKPTRSPKQMDPDKLKLRKFLDNDRKVLRFYCEWDSSESLFGEKRPFVLHYFLVDDTVEVREVPSNNNGRGPWSVFMKKQRLPKKFTGLASMQSRSESDYYTAADFSIGDTINVFGRNMLLYDCDPYTKAFYESKYGVTEWPSVPVGEVSRAAVDLVIPPYTGFGSEEDSLATCLNLVPKPPRKDFNKMAENDKKILRFSAVLSNNNPLDRDRQFVLSYYLSDDTVSVFENPVKNTGIPGGKFLERRRVKHPARAMASPKATISMREIDGQPLQYYQPSDFYVGAVLELNSHKFLITEADEYALKYMEAHVDQFPKADFGETLASLQEKVRSSRSSIGAIGNKFSENDPNRTGVVPADTFASVLRSMKWDVSEQEILTLMRRYDLDDNGNIDYSGFIKAVFGK